MQIDLKASISAKKMVPTSLSQRFPKLSYLKVLSLREAVPNELPPAEGSLKSQDLGCCPSPH